MGGRIHFQILSHAPGPVLWAPGASAVATEAAGRTWLIAYGNRVFEPDRVDLETYAEEVAGALGRSPARARHDLPDGEWIEVFELGPP